MGQPLQEAVRAAVLGLAPVPRPLADLLARPFPDADPQVESAQFAEWHGGVDQARRHLRHAVEREQGPEARVPDGGCRRAGR